VDTHTDNLMACPFCGGGGRVDLYKTRYGYNYKVKCSLYHERNALRAISTFEKREAGVETGQG
jgi:hypothetical protein